MKTLYWVALIAGLLWILFWVLGGREWIIRGNRARIRRWRQNRGNTSPRQ